MTDQTDDAAPPPDSGPVKPPALPDQAALRAILTLVQERGAEKSICPTEAARAMAIEAGVGRDQDAWRRYLPVVRAAAVHLAQTGQIDILRKGRPIEPAAMHGVIRLRLAADREQT